MKNKNMLISIFLVFSTYFLLTLVNEYHVRQTKLFLESNDLYSIEHLFVKDNFETIVDNTFKDVDDLAVFVPLESNNTDIVRGYFSKDYSNKLFPLSKGKFFSIPNSKEALVGNEVVVVENGGREYYVYNNVSYKVIGYLGYSRPSFLDNSVLINDSAVFDSAKKFLTVDGTKIGNNYKAYYEKKDYYQNNIGLDRKINSDFFSPIIYGLSLVIILMSSVLMAYIVYMDLKKENEVNYILGLSTLKRYSKCSSYLLIISLCAGIPNLLSSYLLRDISVDYYFLTKLFCSESVFLLIIFTVFFVKGEGKLRNGINL
ncbi:hypothetical protein LI951_12925 [Enterococcus sp. BWT-B8]|uniref:hypothetical protein n=1 Tax=Enterococcus sp. BWT-B8 TaxID=2885157 RepID=UPI001E29D30F|nr:hypothetical protein [Enterococcus sp. BWT-B8]MCB5952973.1 hypothetical protein [Enterococcus sp. BWT-B8]